MVIKLPGSNAENLTMIIIMQKSLLNIIVSRNNVKINEIIYNIINNNNNNNN